MKRVFLIVLDSVGAGEAPDAAAFGDVGAHTLKRISASPLFAIPTLRELGIGHIPGLSFLGETDAPKAAVAKMTERSMGKDTTIGHWEIAGCISPEPLPTYPNGFPREVLDAFSEATGRGVLCNLPYSGTDVIRDFGEEHMRTGDLIVYTSADSVFQIAANEALLPPEELYEVCRKARAILTGKHAVGRVIARPFVGTCAADFKRTANRRDFSLEPPAVTLPEAVLDAGMDSIAIGKIFDIFAGKGFSEHFVTHGNAEGMDRLLDAVERDFSGLCFANLVDFDMLYGHRNDVDGYAAALTAFDAWLPSFLGKMREEDVLFITADHGCDPGDESTDHTREYVPLLAVGKGISPVSLGVRSSFADLAATVAELLGVSLATEGRSFAKEMTNA
ncbi:MAG: phosphopentomutase [Clostridia bacterium]|nr:phosphopentomutase [Clostridia bacterium]